MKVTIAEAKDDEIPLVHGLMREAFEEYRGRLNPPSGALREEIADIRRTIGGRGGAILAWLDDRPVGSAQYYREENYLYIGRVSVVPAARGFGVGREMLDELEDRARRDGMTDTLVEVRLSLPGKVSFYEKRDYSAIRTVDYPERTDSWYVMSKRL
ncbi:GNAT family N-acetyltransferase [Cohnella suwonensis]|uniref:GNAT family N-acetyltransferase n=1 Tax=Cohnella suwonensis TaxID=696072 RepID=A0ABW0LY58_9BACL